MNIISTKDFSPATLGYFFNKSNELRLLDNGTLEERRELVTRHVGAQAYTLFYEASTRTRGSFDLAAAKLGIGRAQTENAKEFSSAAKGETLEDTIHMFNAYHIDALIIRHHETGAAKRAAAVAADHMSIINAGDGKGEHPTQALLDTYTIHERFKRLDNLNVVIGGDLLQGRTARSLSRLLSQYAGNLITFVSTPEFQMAEDIKQELREAGTKFSESDDVHDAVREADVVYWTRLQRERLGVDKSPEQIKEFVIDQSVLDVMKEDSIIMHPLPRVGEITKEVDNDPRAWYFRQAGNGLYVRMALLDHIMTEKHKKQ
ncbi:aspartate carbamoyltransferase [Candidatus Saccharibacteria bacterium]|nr:aspartate carbamoyltransferase [Candidatus Saccharibacteria bacterium]